MGRCLQGATRTPDLYPGAAWPAAQQAAVRNAARQLAAFPTMENTDAEAMVQAFVAAANMCVHTCRYMPCLAAMAVSQRSSRGQQKNASL